MSAAPDQGRRSGLTRSGGTFSDRYSSANPSGRISALLGPEDLQQRLDWWRATHLAPELVPDHFIDKPRRRGLEVVAVGLVYRPPVLASALMRRTSAPVPRGFQ